MKSDIRTRSQGALSDHELQQNLRRALQHTLQRRAALVAENPRWPLLREQACAIRNQSLDDNDALLAQLKHNIERHGGHIHMCADAAAARRLVVELLQQENVKLVVKGKSMVSEEIELNAALADADMQVYEGDLGELIVQLRGEAPAHITAPALHLNRRQIGTLFAQRFNVERSEDPTTLTAQARAFMRSRFLNADAGITGANFVVAESGSVVLVENESNIRLATTLPRIHIAITGVEKVIAKLADLAPLLTLLPASATGQKMSAAVSILGGPRQSNESDGPQHFHLVLIDNGRRRLLADPHLREALRCLRCGACLNICPVFQRLGGHGFGSVYPGPIGTILSHALLGTRDDGAHAFACSLCGACDEVCPVLIPLSQLILEMRRRAQQRSGPSLEKGLQQSFALLARHPRWFTFALATATRLSSLAPVSWSGSLTAAWTDQRALPQRHVPQRRGPA